MRGTIEERFREKITMDPESGCWRWRALTGNGYGLFFFEGKYRRAHRFSYEAFYGPIPEGMDIDHVCRVRNCVNPTHLRPVTERDNVLIGETVVAKNLAKTHCVHGHPLEGPEALLLEYMRPYRVCRICARANGRKFWAKKAKEN